MNTAGRPLRILTWHVHGNYLYYLTQVPHEFHVVVKPGHPPGYAGRAGRLPWGDNVKEVPIDAVSRQSFDCVLYQHRSHYEHDRLHVLSPAQRELPRAYVEHDPPQEDAFAQRHWAQDRALALVHVTHFNRMMWDSGVTPASVIEHGVIVPEGVRCTGDLARGLVIVNHLRERGRRLGYDVFTQMREEIALDLVGMDAQSAGGIGEIGNLELAAFAARYRFNFVPIRWTSLGLAIVEAMMIGMPIVGLAATELPTVIRNGDSGFVHNDFAQLRAAMRELLRDADLARAWGEGARKTALERFGIDRFVADWMRLFAEITN